MILVILVKLIFCQSSIQIPQYATGSVQAGSLSAGTLAAPQSQSSSSAFSTTFTAQPQIYFSTYWIDQGTAYMCQSLKITSLTLTMITVELQNCGNAFIYRYSYQYLAINDPYVQILNQTVNPSTSQTSQTFQQYFIQTRFSQAWTSVPSYAIGILAMQFQGSQNTFSGSVQVIQISITSVTVLVTQANSNGLFPIQYNIITAPTQFLNSVTQAYDWSQTYLNITYASYSRYCFSLPTITSPSVFVKVHGFQKMGYIQSNNLRLQINFVPGGYINQWDKVFTSLVIIYSGFNYQPFQCNGITIGNQCSCQNKYYISFSGCNQCSTICLNCITQATSCTSCNANAQLFNNVCACITGYYMNTNNVCQQCDIICAACTQTSTTCTSCPTNQILVGTSCQSCPVQTQYLNGQCQQCQANCQTCYLQYCTACQTNYLYQTTSCTGGFSLQQGLCVQTCFVGYFQNSATSCCQCDVSCATCSSVAQCLTCATNYVLQGINCQSSCNPLYYNYQGTCLSCHSSCLTCTSYTYDTCLSCTSPLVFYQNQCLTTCPSLTSNIAGTCIQCFLGCQTCSGNSQTNCLTCTPSYYFLVNTCYQNCPLQFYNDQVNYICQPCPPNCNRCLNITCLVCTQNYYLLNQICYDICPAQTYADQVSQQCLQCDATCATCKDGTNIGCTSCKGSLLLSQGSCITTCLNQFYQSSGQCLQCDVASCYYCNGSATTCTACLNRYLFNNQCLVNCPAGYYGDIQQGTCLTCNSSCKSCFGPTSQNCLSCSSLLLWNSTCIASCPIGTTFYNGNCFDQSYTKLVCSYQCDGCYLSQYTCQSCTANRLNNPPQCSCPLGYYDANVAQCQQCNHKCLTCSGSSFSCIKCLGNRSTTNCTCAAGTYDDLSSVNCTSCEIQCATCIQFSANCLTCRNNRVLNGSICTCVTGFYEINISYCQPCSYQCSFCQSTLSTCSVCSDIRLNPPLCGCPDGYYDNFQSKCQLCPIDCLTCNSLGCLTCPNNRQGPTGQGTCVCSQGALNLLPLTTYCQDCQIAVSLVSFDAQLKVIILSLSTPIVSKITSCNDILAISSLNTLGTNPSCSTNASNIIIALGIGATVQVSDKLEFLPNIIIGSLTTALCTSPFTQFISQPLTLPLVPLTQLVPSVTFNNLDGVSSCQSQSIQFIVQYYDGMRQLKINSISQVLPINDNNPQLSNFLIQINQSPMLKAPIVIPPYTLSHRTNYEFSFVISNFINQQNNQQLKFTTGSTEIVDLVFLTKQVIFYRYLQNQISAQVTYSNCSLNPTQQTPLLIQWILNNTLYEQKYIIGLDQGFSQIVVLTIPKFYLSFGQCSLSLTIGLDASISLAIKNAVFNIVKSPLILSINGANQQYGISQQINLSSNIINHDFQPGDLVQIYKYQWKCIDIEFQTDCLDMQQNIMPMGTQDSQIIAAKRLTPYRAYLINLTISYENTFQSSSGSLAITELDLPVLLFNRSSILNLYDESLITLIYPNTNADALSYSAAIVYNLDVQSTFSFFYLQLKYKQWDYFSNLNSQFSGNITLRTTVYDPRYYMPSIAQIRYIFNVPPAECRISLSHDVVVEFDTLLIVNVHNCSSTNMPLLYRYSIYTNNETYNSDVMSSQDLNRVLLGDFSNQTNLSTYLYFNQTDVHQFQNQIIMVTIQDSLMAITNLTQVIIVQINPKLNEQIFDNLMRQMINVDDRIYAYQLVGNRLISFPGITNYKSQVYNIMIQYLSVQLSSALLSVVEQVTSQLSQIPNIQSSLNDNQKILLEKQIITLINNTQLTLIDLYTLYQNQALTSQLFQMYYQNYQQLNYLIQILSSQIHYYSTQNLSNTNLLTQLTNTIYFIQNLSIPNQPPNIVSSRYLNMYTAVQSLKIINQLTSNLLQYQGQIGSNRLLQITEQAKIYEYSNRKYELNPYLTDQSFPKNSTNYSCVEASLINQETQLKQPILQNASIKLDLNKQTNSTLKCISKINGTWAANICSSTQRNDSVSCINCQQLSPVSLMNAFDLIGSSVEKSFSSDAINALDNFAFWETLIFYVYIMMTCSYIFILYKGHKMDQENKPEIKQNIVECDKVLRSKETPVHQEDIDSVFRFNKYKTIDLHIDNGSPKSLFQNPEGQQHRIYPIDDLVVDGNDHDNKIVINSNIGSQDDLPMSSTRSVKLHISRIKGYFIFLQQFHIVLSIIYKYDKNLSRPVRCSILYISTLGILATIFMFGQQNNISLNIAIALILAPLTKVFSLVFEKLLSSTNKIFRSIGLGLILSVSGLWSYILLSQIALLGSVSQVNQLTINFLITWVFDNLVYAQIQLVLQFTVQIYIINLPLLKSLLDKLLDEQSAKFIEELRQQL